MEQSLENAYMQWQPQRDWDWGSQPPGVIGQTSRSSLVAQLEKNPPAMQETWVRSLGWEDPLGKGTHSSILAWRITWTVWSGRLQSRTQVSDFHFHEKLKNSKVLSRKRLSDWTKLTSCAYGQSWNPSSVQAGQKQGQGPAFLLLKPEQDSLCFNFPNRILMIFFFFLIL